MRIKKMVSLFLTLVLLCCTMIPAFADGEQESGYELGDKMDDFTVTLSDGSEVSLYGLLETKKAVLINLWATWCNPCRMEFPYMQKAYEDMSDDIGIIALSVEETDTDEVINSFKSELGIEALPMGRDTLGFGEVFAQNGIPTSIIVDRNGIICFVETGAITSVSQFKTLLATYTADDYSESVILNELPAVEVAAAPDDAELSAALNAEGGAVEFVSVSGEDGAIYPFLPSDDGSYAYASNIDVENTMASVNAAITVNAGDVLSYEYREAGSDYTDRLSVFVDGECAKINSGNFTEWTQDGIRFEEAGEYGVSFVFNRGNALNPDNVCELRNVKLLTGDEAAAFVSPADEMPKALEGSDTSLEIQGDVQNIVFFANGEPEQSTDSMSMVGDTATIKIQVGKDVDAGIAYVTVNRNMFESDYYMLSNLEQDEEGYYLNVDVTNSETGLNIMLNKNNGAIEATPTAVLMCNADQAAQWLDTTTQIMTMLGLSTKITFELKLDDGTMLASVTANDGTDEASEEASEEAQGGEYKYSVKYVDEDGAPVADVTTQFCDATTCTVVSSDENGVSLYEAATAYPYEIHVLKVPAGYEKVGDTIVMDANGGEEEVVLKKAK